MTESFSFVLQESGSDWKGLDNFLTNAVNWPRRNREGKKNAIGSYCESIIDILEEQNGNFNPSFNAWSKLLTLSVYAARVESNSNWPLVHRCCQALIRNNHMTQDKMGDRLLQIGLDVAERMRDPQMSTDLICNTEVTQYGQFDSSEPAICDEKFDWHPSDVDISGSVANHSRISPNSYMKAIKLCIDCGKPSLGDRILSHCLQAELPAKSLGDMHTLVLTGYARNGDVEKAEHLFNQMKTTGLQLR